MARTSERRGRLSAEHGETSGPEVRAARETKLPRSEDKGAASVSNRVDGVPPVPEASASVTGSFFHLPFPRAESFATHAVAEVIDRASHAAAARLTQGLSPGALALAYTDWAIHLATSPGKQLTLIESALRKWAEFGRFALQAATIPSLPPPCVEPGPSDRRFCEEDWATPPYSLIAQGFLLTQSWWREATTGVRGVGLHHERVVEFAARQLLDTVSPSNFLSTNPEVLRRTVDESGANLLRGLQNAAVDLAKGLGSSSGQDAGDFKPGVDVAVTPGKVVMRNRLIELIQYEPSTPKVHAEPVLIIPAWIMKYYILDLSPENSLVRHLVAQGFTVFMISWRNPTDADRDLGMDDYRKLGIDAALDAIGTIVPGEQIHATGYCIGGTLLAIAAAADARNAESRFKTVTLFAAQVDFNEAGELSLFIDESQLAFLEDMMWERGYLDPKQMAGTFQLLRSNDLIWSRLVRDYLLGERQAINDLAAWNADATRLPHHMHGEYLRGLFLNNDLAEGRYRVDGRPVALEDVRAPFFIVSTETDHVAPWRSVYKIILLSDTETTFVLTNGGHNAGIVSQPGRVGHPRRYRIETRRQHDTFIGPDEWLKTAALKDGSWWPAWFDWLAERSGPLGKPPAMGSPKLAPEPLANAPGDYVRED
jgi:polyhydroxyalkanoate synthase